MYKRVVSFTVVRGRSTSSIFGSSVKEKKGEGSIGQVVM